MNDSVFEGVCQALLALDIPSLERSRIKLDSLLVDDLGLDSLKFVDLTVRLEEAFDLAEFPMQQWVDDELEADRQLSVGRLVSACRELIAKRSTPTARAL